MIKNQQWVKLFLSLFLCTIVIFSFSYFGSKAISLFKKQAQPPTAAIKEKVQSVVPVATEQPTDIDRATVNMKKIPADLQAALNTVSKMDIPVQSSFSLLDLIKKQSLSSLSAETLSIIGTGIYQAILPTNFVIEERNISSEPPTYAGLGDEAKVDVAQNMDFAFSNPNNTPYTLELQLNGNALTVSLRGVKLPNDYQIVKKNQQNLAAKTIVQYSPYVNPGQTVIKNAGKKGQTVDVYRQTFKDDVLINSELIASDYYPPEYRVEIHALDQPATQSGAATDTTTASDQQAASASTDQSNQATQQTTTSGTTTTNGTASTASTPVNTLSGS